MSEAKIPGIKAKHAIISDACREVGDAEAFGDAMCILLKEYDRLVKGPWPRGKGAKFHLVLTVEYD